MVTRGADPTALMKAVKNHVEIEGMRAAHRRDGMAMANFLAWFEREAPGKRFEPVREDAVCRFMKLTTLEKVRDSLLRHEHRVTVEPELADRARLAIERMVALG